MPSLIPPYFYNYYNYDTVNYPLIRLHGVWLNNQGTLVITLNNSPILHKWRYKNTIFKVFIKLSIGKNTIILTDSDGNTKTINIYYDLPRINNQPVLKLVLYDSYDGTGVCDAPPQRTDNKLEDNINRLKTDGLLLQSFFAEAYRASREKQEGLVGLPFTTFNLELDENQEPVVHYLKATDPKYTREFFRIGPNPSTPTAQAGTVGIDSLLRALKPSGKTVYTIGFSLTSHLDRASGIYGGWLGQATPTFGGMNAANLIWHPKSIYELQDIFDDISIIDKTYNQDDNADTPSASYARILGSLLHEFFHHAFNTNHPSEIISIINDNPLSYLFPFDFQEYPNAFGIDETDSTFFRYWFMPYETNGSLVTFNKSEYGPSELGWFSPYAIHGYINTYQEISKGAQVSEELKNIYDRNLTLTPDKKLWIGATTVGFVNSPLLYYHPKYEYNQNSWKTFLKGNYIINSPDAYTFCIAYLWGSGGGEYKLGYSADFNYHKTRNESLRNVFKSTTRYGGAGGFVRIAFPVYPNSELKIVVGDRDGNYGGGGAPFVQNGIPYGAYGGGKSAIYMNNIPMGIAGGGGGGATFSPGQSVGQTVSYTPYDGKSGFIITGSGDSYLLDISSGGGGGHYGGTTGFMDPTLGNTLSFGSGAGSSYINSLCTSLIMKPGIPVTPTQMATSFKSILPSLFSVPPNSIGSSEGDGCVILNFVYVSPSRWNTNYQNYSLSDRVSITESSNDSLDTTIVSIIPRVKNIETDDNFIRLSNDKTTILTSIVGMSTTNEKIYLNEHKNVFTNELLKISGISTTNSGLTETVISLILDKDNMSLQRSSNEFYNYSIIIQDSEPQITVTAGTVAGIAHGTATILQQIRSDAPGESRIATCSINDSSVAEYTTVLIDPARDPIDYTYMCEIVDMCRFYKIRFLHIHGTDDQGWRFYLDPAITDFSHNGQSYSLQALLDPVTSWYSNKDKWNEFNLYCESRGVSIVPEIEYLGHSNYLRLKVPEIFRKGKSIDYGKEITFIALTKMLDQLFLTFPDTPFIFIGTDEATIEFSQDPDFFTLHPQIPRNNNTALLNYFMFRTNNYIRNAGKRMITWENENSSVSYANTNSTIIAQTWIINGGKGGSAGYPEDQYKYDIHGKSLQYASSGISVSQTPWWPRTFSPMINMFDWNPIVTTYVNPTNNINDWSNPIPLNKAIGSTTLLWETHLHKLKLKYLRNKAPIRNENTYNLGRNSISAKTFSKIFEYLNNKFDTLLTGIRIVETGLIKNVSDIMISNTGESHIPVCIFDKNISIQLINNNYNNTTIRYTISNIISESENTTVLDTDLTKSNLYTEPIIFSLYDPFLLNGFFSLKYQLFNSSNQPVGRLVERYYLNSPFNISIRGGYKFQPISLFPNLNNFNKFWFDNTLDIILNSTSISGTVRFNFSRNKLDSRSPILTVGSKIVLSNTTDRIFIALFNESNIQVGGVWSGTFICNKDSYVPDSSTTNKPTNSYNIIPAQSINITNVYTVSTNIIRISSILPSIAPDTVDITVTVVGGGGSSASGGIATETYYDVPTSYGMSIEVGNPGNKSSVSFVMNYLLSNDRNGMKAYQPPIYPTIAYNGAGSLQGVITKGDSTFSRYGYTYNNITYGAPGYQGIVLINIKT